MASEVASVISDAKAKCVPIDTINRRLAAQDMVHYYATEIQAPGGVFDLVETRLRAANVARRKIQGIIKIYGYFIPAVFYPQSF